MRMAELSEKSGVPVATIKYYLREGMLRPGEYSSPNQASYDQAHVDRLRLVRALLDVGGLSVAAVRAVLTAVDDETMPLTWAFGVAQHALPNPVGAAQGADASEPPASAIPDPEHFEFTDSDKQQALLHPELQAVFADHGWVVTARNPGIAIAARVLETYDTLGLPHLKSTLGAYAQAATTVAEADLAAIGMRDDRAEMVESVVVGTVLGDALFAGLRRIAQETVSARVFPDNAPNSHHRDHRGAPQ